MGAIERAFYQVTCPQCGQTGIAEWWETDGPVFLLDPRGGIELPAGFVGMPGVPGDGSRLFFGQRLACMGCGVDATTKEEHHDQH